MPAVSEKQRRAMFAAASGHSTLGIPKKVGEEFVGKVKKDSADHEKVFVDACRRIVAAKRRPDAQSLAKLHECAKAAGYKHAGHAHSALKDAIYGDCAMADSVMMDAWEESKHPRAENGQFGSGNGESSVGKTAKKGASKAAPKSEKQAKLEGQLARFEAQLAELHKSHPSMMPGPAMHMKRMLANEIEELKSSINSLSGKK